MERSSPLIITYLYVIVRSDNTPTIKNRLLSIFDFLFYCYFVVLGPISKGGGRRWRRVLFLGIKFLDGRSNDAREAKVLKHALQYVDIYSNSWGPADTGDVMESLPMHTTKMSLSKGIHEVK